MKADESEVSCGNITMGRMHYKESFQNLSSSLSALKTVIPFMWSGFIGTLIEIIASNELIKGWTIRKPMGGEGQVGKVQKNICARGNEMKKIHARQLTVNRV